MRDSDSHNNMRPHDGQRPSGRRRHYHDRGGRPPDRGNDQERGYSRRGRPPDDRGPLDDGGTPDDGGPPDDGELPDDGGPPGNGRHPQMTRPTRTSWTHTTYHSTAIPGRWIYQLWRIPLVQLGQC